MNRRQRDKALAELAVKLATQLSAKDDAHSQGNEIHFDAMCAAITATQAEIWSVHRADNSCPIDGLTAGLIAANID